MKKKSTIAVIEEKSDLGMLLEQHHLFQGVKFASVISEKEALSEQSKIVIDNRSKDECILHILKNDSQISLKKPIKLRWLIEKLNFLLLRDGKENITIGSWRLDCIKHELKIDEQLLQLTEKETTLMACLLQLYPKAIEKGMLQEYVWGYADNVDSQTLQTHIYRLRQKLGGHGEAIKTSEEGYYLSFS